MIARTLFAVLVALAPLATHAAPQEPTPGQACEKLGTFAAAAMRARQYGEPMSSHSEPKKAVPSETNDFVTAAYEYPRYSTPELQQKAVIEFRNLVESNCKLLLQRHPKAGH